MAKHAKFPPRPQAESKRIPSALPFETTLGIYQPDKHCPFHDLTAHKLMCRVIEHLKPEILVVGGDHFDFWAVSDHRKDPKRKVDLAHELQVGDECLRDFEAFGTFKRKVFCKGNHEWRLDRYIADHAYDAVKTLAPAGILQIKTLEQALGWAERGWEVVEYKNHVRIGSNLYFTHDVEKAGRTAHESARADFAASIVIGHTHRFGYSALGSQDGAATYGAMVGWLGDHAAIDYKNKMKALREWPLGFGIFSVEKGSGFVHFTPVLIQPGNTYHCVVFGKLFAARRLE